MFVDRQPQGEEARLATAIGAIHFIARVAVWALVGLLVLSALNINITALIAGLGIGGVAVALAAQNVLGDLFASLSILLDRPFAVGHFIVVGDMAGTVEHVGIKSTRIRSLSGEEIVQSNTNLLNARIHNYRHLYDRRVLFAFGVTYDTPYQKLTAIPEIVREIIQGIEKTRFDRAHFKEYGDSALNFEVVYYVLSPEAFVPVHLGSASGRRAVSICEKDGSTARRISRRRLETLVRGRTKPSGRRCRRVRNAIASTLLRMIASGLPNSFGDFGVVSVSGSLRFARTTRAFDRHRFYR
jgi:hypothetical protein